MFPAFARRGYGKKEQENVGYTSKWPLSRPVLPLKHYDEEVPAIDRVVK